MTALRSRAPVLLAALPAVALFLGWTADDGGYAPTTWYTGALLLGAVAAGALIGLGPRRRRLDPRIAAALLALAAYTVWSFASMAWADSPGVALEGANRTLLYLIVASLFALLPWTPGTLRLVLTVYVLGMGALALVTLLVVAGDGQPTEHFVDARLSAPLGYQTAAATAWAMPTFAALVLASRAETHIGLRAVLLGLAAVFVETSLISQSRGWLATVAVVLLALLVITPGRLRLLIHAAPVALATVIASGPLLEVHEVGGISFGDLRTEDQVGAAVAQAFDPALRAVLLGGVGVAVAGLLLALADRRLPQGEGFARATRRIGVVLAALAAAAAIAGAVVVSDGDPLGKVDEAIADFKDYDTAGDEQGGSRFTSLGSSRYDFWRVGVDLWREDPVTGLGQDNYGAHYLPLARSGEMPRWVHSWPLRLLVHTGAVGFLLFGAFLAGVAAAGWRVRRALSTSERAVQAAALAPLLVWLVAGVYDWFWEIPALSGPALGLGVAAVVLVPRRSGEPVERARPLRAPALAGLVTAGVLALLALVPAWLSVRQVDQARAALPDVGQAFEHIHSAADLNPWSTAPALLGGVVSVRLREDEVARTWFEQVLERDELSWFAHLELGLLLAEEDEAAARAHLERARQLNPNEDVVAEAAEALASGDPPDVREVNAELAAATRRVAQR